MSCLGSLLLGMTSTLGGWLCPPRWLPLSSCCLQSTDGAHPRKKVVAFPVRYHHGNMGSRQLSLWGLHALPSSWATLECRVAIHRFILPERAIPGFHLPQSVGRTEQCGPGKCQQEETLWSHFPSAKRMRSSCLYSFSTWLEWVPALGTQRVVPTDWASCPCQVQIRSRGLGSTLPPRPMKLP
jgi:hypothetical protein